MKKLLTLIVLLNSIFLFSEDMPDNIDKEYLESLPEGVRGDVLKKMEAQKDIEKPIYRRASTMIDKELEDEDKTGIFGEDIFDVMQTSFMPVNEPNFDGTYILDFGDVLEIQFIGQEDSIGEYPIRRDGSVNLPEIGQVYLSGLSLNDANALIKAKVQDAIIGTEVYVSITNVRDIQILVTGNTFNPGIYTLNGNSNMLHALAMAGGINKNGSYRNIKLLRNNQEIENLDLYDLFIFGKSGSGIRLRSGDSIMVGPLGKVAIISNGINRPGIYEIKDGETFKDLINFANGFNSNADTKNMQIQRLFEGKISISNIEEGQLDSILINDKDNLLITEFKYNTVKISGAVKYPGTFKLNDNETIKDLINRAGGYDESAYPFGGYLKNLKSIELNEEAKEKLYNKFLNQIIEGSLIKEADTVIPIVLEELRNAEVSGRVIAEFDVGILTANPEKDTLLEDGDEILIPRVTQQVYVYGEVNNQGATRYFENRSIEYYIKSNGGTSRAADLDNIFIVQPNGMTQSIQSNSRKLSLINSNTSSIPVYPGSIIYVPKEIKTTAVESAAIWGPIISSLALSLTSLSVLDNN
tara:strand:+ start:988 stop:2733 length:1746 start_codon:yes stop_codon:yes gene_type:complete